jgi:pSer/pThr/pTyr-binding forkhead associated (FHA) protein
MAYHGVPGAVEIPPHESPPAPRTLLGFLVSYDGNPLGQFWSLHRGANLLGRAGAATSAHVELPHATISSRHATIVAHLSQGGALPAAGLEQLNPLPPLPANTVVRLFISDHGSTNGTYVNDVALAPDQQRELHDGDRVRLGLFNLLLKII